MAGVRNRKEPNGKYRGYYLDGAGIQRHFTGSDNKTETRNLAIALEKKFLPVRLGLAAGVESGASCREVVKQYLAWGALNGGRNGKPWGKTHFRMRKAHLEFWISELSVEKVAELNGCLSRVEATLKKLSDGGAAGKTLANYSEGISAFCDFLVKRNYLEADPLKQLGRFDTSPKIKRRALTKGEIQLLLNTCAPHRRLCYEVAFCSGLRANELRSLIVSDLDVDRGGLVLRSSWTKNRQDDFQPLPQHLVEDLAKSVKEKEPGERLLWVPAHPARYLKKDLDRCGIKHRETDHPDGKVDFHACRVAYTTFVVESGASVKEAQALARHSDPKLTMNTYAKARDARLKNLAESVGSMVRTSLTGNAATMRPPKKIASFLQRRSQSPRELDMTPTSQRSRVQIPPPRPFLNPVTSQTEVDTTHSKSCQCQGVAQNCANNEVQHPCNSSDHNPITNRQMKNAAAMRSATGRRGVDAPRPNVPDPKPDSAGFSVLPLGNPMTGEGSGQNSREAELVAELRELAAAVARRDASNA